MNNEERVIVTVRDGMSPDMNEGDPVIDCAVESLHKGRGGGVVSSKRQKKRSKPFMPMPNDRGGP